MSQEIGPEAVPIGFTSTGQPGLYAVPLPPADLCEPRGRWSVLRAPHEDHPQAAGIFENVVFPTRDVGYVRARDGLLLKTEDGGYTWSFVRHDLPTPGAMLAFPTASAGYLGVRRARLLSSNGRPVSYEAGWEVGTPQTLLRTGDGGHTWEILTPLVDAPLPRRNRAFLPHTASYDVAAMVAHLQSGQGTHEAPHELPGTLGHLRMVVFPSADVGYALVLVDERPPSEAHVLMRSSDGGHTWRVVLTREQLAPLRPYPWPMAFPRPDIGYMLLPDNLLCTADGGATWEARSYPTELAVSSIIFATATTGYGLAAVISSDGHDHNPEWRRVLLRTEDGGRTWRQTDRGGAVWPLGCPSPQIILAGGTAGMIWRSADGGLTWRAVESGTSHPLLALACPDEDTCYGVASDATIIKSGDGGQRWQVLTAGTEALYRMLGAPHLTR